MRDRFHTAGEGFTLLELTVAFALLALALAAIGGTIASTIRAVGVAEHQLEVQQSARVGIDRMTEELRWAEAVVPDAACPGLCPDRLTVRVAPHNPLRPGAGYVVTFRRDARDRELERRLGTAVNNLAGSLEALAFRYFDRAGAAAARAEDVVRVEISVVFARSAGGLRREHRLTTAVFLRNIPAPP